MNESPKIEKRDYVPRNFEPVAMPKSYATIWMAIKEEGHQYVGGFEDVLSGEKLGNGMQSNNQGGIFQLVFALSIVRDDRILEIARRRAELTPSGVVKQLREIQVLSGMKIIDLGCGEAYFARAAAALGAKVYTADAKELDPNIKAKLKGHIRTRLTSESLGVLKNATGGNFDLVTEWIMAPMHNDDVNLHAPSKDTILQLGEGLLKRGGYLFQELARSKPLRKK